MMPRWLTREPFPLCNYRVGVEDLAVDYVRVDLLDIEADLSARFQFVLLLHETEVVLDQVEEMRLRSRVRITPISSWSLFNELALQLIIGVAAAIHFCK